MAETKQQKLAIEKIVTDVLKTIDREREREIISRRFGLFDRKETLEQIGELLGITRERVRQLEKAVIAKLKALADAGQLPHINEVQEVFLSEIHELGKVARVSDLAPKLAVIEDNDNYHHAVGIKEVHDEKKIKDLVSGVIDAVRKIGAPTSIDKVAEEAKHPDPSHTGALASISKHLATLNGRWGLIKWPMVNPKNIRDKIYVILHENGKHMHFNEIAASIKDSDFKRKDVTTQAIHNELIKDKRFVLIGRGIYALKEWGYEKGTVADIITQVLKKAKEPMHRDDIVKHVLKSRYVKETTILLNLQGKQQFRRVAKATYELAE